MKTKIFEQYARAIGAPARKPSILPPPGNVHLQLALGEQLGSGRTSTVYAVNPVSDAACSEIAGQYPPLVIKVGTQLSRRHIARDAWFYEELECLQGSGIPRCYGFFDAVLSADHDILPWHNATKEESLDGSDDERKASKWDPPIQRIVSILVLERLGDKLPLCKPLPPGAR